MLRPAAGLRSPLMADSDHVKAADLRVDASGGPTSPAMAHGRLKIGGRCQGAQAPFVQKSRASRIEPWAAAGRRSD